MRGKLFLVGTPIGNLDDFSKRAIDTLNSSDVIYCEDTRVSSKLLSSYGINKPLKIYETHRENKATEGILNDLDMGKNVSLISDAGMPGISDPGEKVIKEAALKDYPMTVIPGANAGISALLLSGFPTGKFFFEGFLPSRGADRMRRLKEVLKIPYTVILYEAPHRMNYLLDDIDLLAPDRRLSVSREITKFYEETVRGTASQIKSLFNEGFKGEIVVIISAYEESDDFEDEEVKKILEEKIKSGISKKDAIRETVKITGRKKNEIYALSLKIEAEND